jgi:hypothetical protein
MVSIELSKVFSPYGCREQEVDFVGEQHHAHGVHRQPAVSLKTVKK